MQWVPVTLLRIIRDAQDRQPAPFSPPPAKLKNGQAPNARGAAVGKVSPQSSLLFSERKDKEKKKRFSTGRAMLRAAFYSPAVSLALGQIGACGVQSSPRNVAVGIVPILQMTNRGSERLSNLPKVIQVAPPSTGLPGFRACAVATRHCLLAVVGG